MREPGFYWVKNSNRLFPELCFIAKWDGDMWWLSGQRNPHPACKFEVIGGRIEPPKV